MARAIFLGSAPHMAQQSMRGIDDAHIRLARDLRTIAEEILQYLAALPNASVRVSLQIEADASDGIPEQVVWTVIENSRTLKLPAPQFEQDRQRYLLLSVRKGVACVCTTTHRPDRGRQ